MITIIFTTSFFLNEYDSLSSGVSSGVSSDLISGVLSGVSSGVLSGISPGTSSPFNFISSLLSSSPLPYFCIRSLYLRTISLYFDSSSALSDAREVFLSDRSLSCLSTLSDFSFRVFKLSSNMEFDA